MNNVFRDTQNMLFPIIIKLLLSGGIFIIAISILIGWYRIIKHNDLNFMKSGIIYGLIVLAFGGVSAIYKITSGNIIAITSMDIRLFVPIWVVMYIPYCIIYFNNDTNKNRYKAAIPYLFMIIFVLCYILL